MKNWLQIITLILCLLLLVIVIAQGNQLDRYQQSLDDRMNMLQSYLTAEIDSVSDRVEAVILYRWNRTYPADLRFDWTPSDFYLESAVEFPGNSHEKITREIYQRKEK